jgi:KDO2-lipid IV(A) lauroyltransferase
VVVDNSKNSTEFSPSFYGPKYWLTWIGLGCFYLLSRLPLGAAVRLGSGLGHIFYYLAPARRRIAEINIALCFPELSAKEQQQLVRRTLCAVGINFFEGALGLWGPFETFRNRHQVNGLEHVEAARKLGRGILLVGAHFTTIDVAGRILSEYERFDVLFRSDGNPLFDLMIKRARETFAGDAIPRNDTRQMIKNLRQGHMIWYAPDQDYRTQHRVFAPFLGVPAATIIGTSRIARLGNAVVLPLSHYRDEQGCYHIDIHPPLEDFPSGDDLIDATRINSIIEVAVRKHPEQYLWVHRRFKNRPPGEPPVYPPKKKKRRKPEPTA